MGDFFTVENAKAIATTVGTIIVFGAVFVVTIKKFIKQALDKLNSNKTDWKDLPQRADLDRRILERMEQVKELTSCDRIMVFDFHNGEHFANNRSALKTSCTYEVTKYGINKEQAKAQGIPLSMLPHLLEFLLEKESFCVDPLSDYKVIQPEFYFCQALNAEAIFCNAIKDAEGSTVGFLLCQYTDELNKTRKTEFIKLAGFIESALQAGIKKVNIKKK